MREVVSRTESTVFVVLALVFGFVVGWNIGVSIKSRLAPPQPTMNGFQVGERVLLYPQPTSPYASVRATTRKVTAFTDDGQLVELEGYGWTEFTNIRKLRKAGSPPSSFEVEAIRLE